MTKQDNMLRPFTCPLCNLVGDPELMINDLRWVNPVHLECVSKLDRWPKDAKNPLGKHGSDSYREYPSEDD